MSSDQQTDWQQRYQEALLELDPAKLLQRIDRAYDAIQRRMDLTWPNASPTERQAWEDALANLRLLRREAASPASNRPLGEVASDQA
jgi:hypothetical protein